MKNVTLLSYLQLNRITSIVTVFVNKKLLSGIDLDAPLFVTWFQCVVSSIICFSLSRLSILYPQAIHFPAGNPLCMDTFKKVLYIISLITIFFCLNTFVGSSLIDNVYPNDWYK